MNVAVFFGTCLLMGILGLHGTDAAAMLSKTRNNTDSTGNGLVTTNKTSVNDSSSNEEIPSGAGTLVFFLPSSAANGSAASNGTTGSVNSTTNAPLSSDEVTVMAESENSGEAEEMEEGAADGSWPSADEIGLEEQSTEEAENIAASNMATPQEEAADIIDSDTNPPELGMANSMENMGMQSPLSQNSGALDLSMLKTEEDILNRLTQQISVAAQQVKEEEILAQMQSIEAGLSNFQEQEQSSSEEVVEETSQQGNLAGGNNIN